MKKCRATLIIMLSWMILLSVSACEKKPKVPLIDTWLEAEQSIHAAEESALAAEQSAHDAEQSALEAEQTATHTKPEHSEESKPSETSATIPPKPTPTAVPVSPFENFSFDLTGNQTSLYARKLHIASGSDQTYFFGTDTLLSTPGSTMDLDTDICQYGYYSRIYSDEQYSIDGSSAAVIVEWDGYATGTLVYCDGLSVVRIAEDVDSFILSSDGSHLAYLTGAYEHGVGGSLYLYHCKTAETEFIAERVGRLFVLSPTGTSISYTTFYRKYDPDSLICYVKTGSESAIEVGRDRYCIALSDDAKTIYCVKRECSGYELYVYHDQIEKLLCDSLPLEGPTSYLYYDNSGPAFIFNNDCTQIVYSDSESTWFYVRGEEPIVVFDSGNAILMGKRGAVDALEKTLFGSNYQERLFTDYARSRCSTSYSGTPNLCYVLFSTDSEVGIFDKFLIPHTVTQVNSYVEQDEFGTMIVSLYQSSNLKINPHLDESWSLKGDEYLGQTEDGRFFYVRDEALYSRDIDGAVVKQTDIIGVAVPYCTPYLERIFILDYQDQEFSFDDKGLENTDFFCSLYSIDPNSPTVLNLVSEKVARYSLMIQGRDITYAQYLDSIEESDGFYSTSAHEILFYSSDGLNFKSITTFVQDYYIMGG
jgi:hypothetical protein